MANTNYNNNNHILKRIKKAGKVLGISLLTTATIATAGLGITIYKGMHPSTNTNHYQQPSSGYTEIVNDYISSPTYNEFNVYDQETPKIPISLSDYSHMNILDSLQNKESNFTMSEYYGLDQALNMYQNTRVTKSTSTDLLTADGKIDAQKLMQKVLENNEAVVKNGKNQLNVFYDDLSSSELSMLCEKVAEVTNNSLSKEDIKKVANTLDKFTMFKRTGSVSNAYISSDLTLVYNPIASKNYEDLQEITGESSGKTIDGVITHEIMHIIQYGSNDTNNKNGVEAGFCRMYNNEASKIPVDSLWYSWVLDGSAELGMSKYLNIDPGTYQKKISYIKSYNLSRFNEINSKEQSLENAVFNPNLEETFKDLGLESEQEKQDFLKYMYSVEITQVDTNDFWKYYETKTGKILTSEEKTGLRMDIRTDAVKHLTEQFFENLSDAIHEGKVSDLNTAFYLMRTWELDTYNHLEYTKTASLDHAKDFITWYDQTQNSILTSIAESSNLDPTEVQTMYNDYNLQVETQDQQTRDNCDLSNFNGYMQQYISSAKNNYRTSNFSRIHDVAEQIKTANTNTQQNIRK